MTSLLTILWVDNITTYHFVSWWCHYLPFCDDITTYYFVSWWHHLLPFCELIICHCLPFCDDITTYYFVSLFTVLWVDDFTIDVTWPMINLSLKWLTGRTVYQTTPCPDDGCCNNTHKYWKPKLSAHGWCCCKKTRSVLFSITHRSKLHCLSFAYSNNHSCTSACRSL